MPKTLTNDFNSTGGFVLYLRSLMQSGETGQECRDRQEAYIDKHCTGRWGANQIGSAMVLAFEDPEDLVLMRLKYSL